MILFDFEIYLGLEQSLRSQHRRLSFIQSFKSTERDVRYDSVALLKNKSHILTLPQYTLKEAIVIPISSNLYVVCQCMYMKISPQEALKKPHNSSFSFGRYSQSSSQSSSSSTGVVGAGVTTGAAALVVGTAAVGTAATLVEEAGRVMVWRVVGTAEVTTGAATVDVGAGAAAEEEATGAGAAPDPLTVKSTQDS